MTSTEIKSAPRARRMLAGAIDAALVGGGTWLWRKRRGGESARAARWMPVLELAAESLRQQLRSPGQLLLGLRTVDRRTGRRLELWRTLVLLGAGVARGVFMRRLAPPRLTPEQERDRSGFLDELNAIQARHPDDAVAREAERRQLFERQHNQVPDILRHTAAPMLAIGLLNSRLRRRLAPTTEVLAEDRESHNP
ncbi:MAG TPA: hypothetical protein VK721_15745 [Solirubrobacteraceae bacterium]|jgi:hypothetical protein|nr:hypothetical protein [Solirubrobacteraceae bacterium]